MNPGDELDELVADIVYPSWRDDFGKPDWSDLPRYSTDIGAAMIAFEWLEQNHPWKQDSICLGKPSEYDKDGQPASEYPQIFRITRGWPCDNIELIAVGESYAHAICLAIFIITAEGKE